MSEQVPSVQGGGEDQREAILYSDGSVLYAKSAASCTVVKAACAVGPIVVHHQEGTWDLEMGPITETIQPKTVSPEETKPASGEPEELVVDAECLKRNMTGCLFLVLIVAIHILPFSMLLLSASDKAPPMKVVLPIIILCPIVVMLCVYGAITNFEDHGETGIDTAVSTQQAA